MHSLDHRMKMITDSKDLHVTNAGRTFGWSGYISLLILSEFLGSVPQDLIMLNSMAKLNLKTP